MFNFKIMLDELNFRKRKKEKQQEDLQQKIQEKEEKYNILAEESRKTKEKIKDLENKKYLWLSYPEKLKKAIKEIVSIFGALALGGLGSCTVLIFLKLFPENPFVYFKNLLTFSVGIMGALAPTVAYFQNKLKKSEMIYNNYDIDELEEKIASLKEYNARLEHVMSLIEEETKELMIESKEIDYSIENIQKKSAIIIEQMTTIKSNENNGMYEEKREFGYQRTRK